MIRVLVVDDSKTMRDRVRLELERAPDIRVCGVAGDGAEGVRLAGELKPDVVLMDLTMPDLDGFEATRQIMSRRPVPVIVLTGRDPDEVSRRAFECGAADLVAKERIGPHLCSLVQAMADVKVVGLHVRARASSVGQAERALLPRGTVTAGMGLVVIGASTGGPQALNAVLAGLSPGPAVAYAVVQHIATGFLDALLDWLRLTTKLELRVAQHGDRLAPGVVHFAPTGRHLAVGPQGALSLDSSPARNGVRPAADVLFETAAESFGARALGLLLTGMGSDGAEGLRKLFDVGATTLTQSRESCVIYGMPRAAVELGASRAQVAPREAAAVIERWALQFRRAGA